MKNKIGWCFDNRFFFYLWFFCLAIASCQNPLPRKNVSRVYPFLWCIIHLWRELIIACVETQQPFQGSKTLVWPLQATRNSLSICRRCGNESRCWGIIQRALVFLRWGKVQRCDKQGSMEEHHMEQISKPAYGFRIHCVCAIVFACTLRTIRICCFQ